MSQFQDELRKNESDLIEDEKKFREELFKVEPHRASTTPPTPEKRRSRGGPSIPGAWGVKGLRDDQLF